MPLHLLHLKEGAMIVLLRNLDITNDLCNGVRLNIDTIGNFTLGCKFISGARKDEFVVIP